MESQTFNDTQKNLSSAFSEAKKVYQVPKGKENLTRGGDSDQSCGDGMKRLTSKKKDYASQPSLESKSVQIEIFSWKGRTTNGKKKSLKLVLFSGTEETE